MSKNNSNDFEFYFSLIKLHAKVRKFEKESIKNKGIKITPKMIRCITFVDSMPNITESEILNILDITKGTLSLMFKSLVDRGYMNVEPHKKDKRKKIFHLTKKGHEIVEFNRGIRNKINAWIRSNYKNETIASINVAVDKFLLAKI